MKNINWQMEKYCCSTDDVRRTCHLWQLQVTNLEKISVNLCK
uniref:Uncharacterized protein n=1 Tax=Rhizophora mucronata TaxID=61149 RepID=A0A2P2QUM6_RHIMU